jgi:uncharacterized protein YutE (UPF0331/DUF86 family)
VIDAVLLTRKMALIVPDLRELGRLAAMSEAEYLADDYAEVLAERWLERVIGRMIDINYHLVTELGQPPPRDYYESFLQLGKLKVLDAELARRLAPAAGLRNRIAHEYDEIDPRKVHAALADAIRDIPRYLAAIERHVDACSDPGP